MDEQYPTPPLDDDATAPSVQIEESSLIERALIWGSEQPWWAIILVIIIVSILYAMSTSVAYQEATRWLTEDPQVHTDDLFEVVQVVGEPTIISGAFAGETTDSVDTVINELIENSIESELVHRSGFIERENPATLTIRLDDGSSELIRKEYIVDEQREDTADGVRITVDYVDRVTITGTLVERDEDTMRIRTVDEETEEVAKSAVLNITPGEGEQVVIQRQGEEVTAHLTTLSNTAMDIQYEDDSTDEKRLSDLEWYHVSTLTIAVNEDANAEPVAAGDMVRVGYVQDTDILSALAELSALDDVPVPLRYSDGMATVALVPFLDVDAAMAATGAGEVDGVLYLDASANRFAVADWVDAHPDAGVVIPDAPRECVRNCEVTFKLLDDEVTGVIIDEDEDSYLVQTVTPQFVTIDRDKILEDKRMQPGQCALNNWRACDEGVFLTLRVTFQAYLMALIIGLIVGLMRIPSNPSSIPARWLNTFFKTISTLYVEIVRGIPLLVILIYVAFVISPELNKISINIPNFITSILDVILAVINLPFALWNSLGIYDIGDLGTFPDPIKVNLNNTQKAVLGLAFGYGAFIAEIFRAGIQSIGRGQMEAARSLGMSYPQAMRKVILPQAVRVVLPPLGNDLIAMLKDSALISVLALPDLLQLGRLFVARTFRAIEGYNTVAVLYLIMTLFLSMVVRVIERRSRLPQ